MWPVDTLVPKHSMNIGDIVRYWQNQIRADIGDWVHPEDVNAFREYEHTFNLDFPVSPYVGDILNAPVIILGANADKGGSPIDTS